MYFGEKTGRSAFFAVNGTEVVRLSKAPFNSDDFVCIGKSVPIRSGGISLCDADLYVSNTGAVAAVLYGLFDGGSLSARADGVIRQCASVLSTWSHRQLDDVAHGYFYETEGQAALVTDVLAKCGKIGCSDQGKVESAIDKALSSGSFTVVATDAAHIDRSTRRFVRDFCFFRGIDPDVMTEFILELEVCSGVAAIMRGSKLGILYAPPKGTPPIPLFYFQVSDTRADLCVRPAIVHHGLERGGFSPLLANDLLEFLLQFADKKQTPVPVCGGDVDTLYMLPEPLFESSQELVEQIERLARALM